MKRPARHLAFIYIDKSLHRACLAVARRDRQTFSDVVRRALAAEVERQRVTRRNK